MSNILCLNRWRWYARIRGRPWMIAWSLLSVFFLVSWINTCITNILWYKYATCISFLLFQVFLFLFSIQIQPMFKLAFYWDEDEQNGSTLTLIIQFDQLHDQWIANMHFHDFNSRLGESCHKLTWNTWPKWMITQVQ